MNWINKDWIKESVNIVLLDIAVPMQTDSGTHHYFYPETAHACLSILMMYGLPFIVVNLMME